ncbi:MAG: ATP-binding cassette domain-containing protein [Verrucomicrobia bacterium]|nr:MAG: ATP-binding cassette domain-containing protein [Verrucomicrobiota bacterium]
MIQLENVYKTYRMGDTTVRALNGVSLEIRAGEFVAIMGASGSGKSTLMHVLGLLDQPTSGAFRLFGRDVSRLSEDELAILRSRTVGFVFQQFHLLARTSAAENAALPALYSFDPVPDGRAAELLRGIGLGERLQHNPNELSGGQQQRVAIARSLVNDPQILFADEPTGNLDSTSAEEIMGILTELNRQGKTIILVTHEPDLAQYAKRIIRLRDGHLLADEPNTPRPTPHTITFPSLGKNSLPGFQGSERSTAFDGAGLLPGRAARLRSSLRRIGPLLRQAFRSIAAAKVRSALSMLGILIGVGAIIAVLALGTGAKEAMRRSLSSLGSNLLSLNPGAVQSSGVRQAVGATTRLTLDDAEELPKAIPLIARASAFVRDRGQTVFQDHNWNTEVDGVAPAYQQMRNWEIRAGRFFTEGEMNERHRVAVIGATVARELFGEGNTGVGEFIRINRVSFQVIGSLAGKGASSFGDQDDVILIPVTTAMYRLMGRRYVDRIYAEARTMAAIPLTQDRILEVMKRRHHIPPSQENPFEVRNMAEIQEALMSTTRTMSVLGSSIAVISLLVGGIGIMNIMLVSVTERTREIGLRKAIGARRGEIMMQFLVEALVISVTGGCLGILLGWGISFGMKRFADWPTSVSVQSVALAVIFSGLVGIVFGLWPARKAALLNPIEALRYE